MKKKNGSVLLGIVGELDDALIAEAAEPMTPSLQQEIAHKKGLFLRRMAVIAAAVLLLCGLAVGTVLILDRRSPGVSAEKVPLCVTDDLKGFVAHWQMTHDEQGMDFLVVPIAQGEEYHFWLAEENENNYFYYFLPAPQPEGGVQHFNSSVAITVTLMKHPDSYAGVLKQLGLTDRDGKAYSDTYRDWIFNYNGHCLSVRFPDGMYEVDYSMVTDLFEFLIFTEDSMPTLPEKETATEPPVTDIP